MAPRQKGPGPLAFLAVAAFGFSAYALLLKQREQNFPASRPKTEFKDDRAEKQQ
ncbi:hypothetical protein EXIGLDRAFT_719190 [Exidia glandulosa HHB12029]|uniref:Uncharacterized protein n=1 Tax=Exidia glandulosa HHB12029 TaxID=1314781 RepID=A0A165H8C9_EXIGL|nr:hypothetical protein EXIGLDRAFT_719190 [Exidia glandulosa HHB12029]